MKNNGSALHGGVMVRLGCGLLALVMLLGLLFAGGAFAYADNTAQEMPMLSAVDTANGFCVQVKGASVPADTATLVLKPVSDDVLNYARNGRTLSENEFFLMYQLCFEDNLTHEEVEVKQDAYRVYVYFTEKGECFSSIDVAAVGGTLGELETKAANKLAEEAAAAEKAAAEEAVAAPAEETTAPAEETTAPVEETTAPVEETTAPVEETTAPVAETTAPAEETTAPVAETTAPVEETPAPVAETTAPVEETPAPVAETAAPAEETTAPAEETTAPAEETVAPAEETAAPAEETTAPAEETPAADRNLKTSEVNVGAVFNSGDFAAFDTDGLGILKFTGTSYNVNDLPATEDSIEETAEPATLYDRLMACETLDEIYSIMENATEEEVAEMEAFTDEQNAALSEKMAALDAYGVETLDEYIAEIAIGNSYTVTKSGTNRYARNLSVTDNSGNNVDGFTITERTSGTSGYTIRVGNDVADGTYIATVTWSVTSGNGWNQTTTTYTDTITINVFSGNVPASVYFLKSPTGDPSGNGTSTWGDEIITATINKRGAIYEELDSYGPKNCFVPANHITAMPTGMVKQDDGSYLLPKALFPDKWSTIYTTYKTTWEAENNTTLGENDIEGIYLKPYKLSQNNSTGDNYTYPDHVDCTVSVKLKDTYMARFYVTKPGTSAPALVDSATYNQNESVVKTTKVPSNVPIENTTYPETITTSDGKEYVFDGWYSEAGNKISDSDGWPYTPNPIELSDGTVDFFAKYVPSTAQITVTKQVSGNMLSHNDSFKFTVKVNGTEDASKAFSLKHGESATLTVNVGDSITITEATGNYDTKYKIGTGSENNGSDAVIDSVTVDQNITFYNNKDVDIDTGVSLDSLPYILILGVVAVGAVVIVVSRSKHRRDY